MIDFVCTRPLLRITLRIAMDTMHFHIAQTGLLLGTSFLFRVPSEQFGNHEKLSCGGAR